MSLTADKENVGADILKLYILKMLPQFPRSVEITWNSRRESAPAVNITV